MLELRLFNCRTAPVFDGGTASANVWRPNHPTNAHERTPSIPEPKGPPTPLGTADTRGITSRGTQQSRTRLRQATSTGEPP